MARRLSFRHRYPVDPDLLFAMAIDLDVLDADCKPWVTFDHLPSGPVWTGQRLDVALSVLGVLPAQPFSMHVLLCDPEARLLRSEQRGVGIARMLHEVRVAPDGAGAVLIDEIDIEAGRMTGLAAACAGVIHRWRHRKRLRLLAER